MSETIRFIYELVLVDGKRLKAFVLYWYDIEAALMRNNKTRKIDLPERILFIEKYCGK
jgi:hypothetical protein